MEKSKGEKAFEALAKLKFAELNYFFQENSEVIKEFLRLKKEWSDLNSKMLNAKMNNVDELLKNHKPIKWTQAELDDQLRQIEALKNRKSK